MTIFFTCTILIRSTIKKTITLTYKSPESSADPGFFQLNQNFQTANSSLDTLIKSTDINGVAFERNFNRISFDLDSGVNKLSYFVITDASRPSWKGIPSSMPNTGVIMGYREVFRRSPENILVKITEMLPTPGKQYYNLYNAGTWTGWKTLTPQ